MTVTTFISCKGAPGVTTLACLVGATWPDQRRAAVVEGDYFGGDLAARFRLSVSRGWTSYVTATRRSEGFVALEPHLQALPGGLDVMIGARGGGLVGTNRAVQTLVESCGSSDPTPWDLVIDGGRVVLEDIPGATTGWLDHSDSVVVVVRRDAPSIFSVRDRTRALEDRWGSRVSLVVVGNGRHHNAAIEDFTGLAVIGEVPFDHAAARVASGGGGAGRRLSRSLLVVSARRLAMVLAATDQVGGTLNVARADGVSAVDRDRSEPPVPVTGGDGPQRLRHLGRRFQLPPLVPLSGKRTADGRSLRARGMSGGQEPGARNIPEKSDPEVTPREPVL